VYRLSIFAPETAPPAVLTYNHFLITGDEPLLFHCGKRKTFPLVSAAVAQIMPVKRLRWLAFGHFEADECGSTNEWLAAAPGAELTHGMVGRRVSICDMADRPPRVLSSGEVIDIGKASDTLTHHMCRMDGMPVSCSRRQQVRCCVETFLRRSEMVLRSRTATSSDPQVPQELLRTALDLGRAAIKRLSTASPPNNVVVLTDIVVAQRVWFGVLDRDH
jgi:hypothetical protein